MRILHVSPPRGGGGGFWNIDADDTFFLATNNEIKNILTTALKYSQLNNIDALSLDMHFSTTKGKFQTLGVTLFRNTINWLDVIENALIKTNFKKLKNIFKDAIALDVVFDYMNREKLINFETFYVENLKFAHITNGFPISPHIDEIYHWKNGRLRLELLYYILDLKNIGDIPIAQNAVKLYTVSESEINNFIMEYSPHIAKIQKSNNPFLLQGFAEEIDAIFEHNENKNE